MEASTRGVKGRRDVAPPSTPFVLPSPSTRPLFPEEAPAPAAPPELEELAASSAASACAAKVPGFIKALYGTLLVPALWEMGLTPHCTTWRLAPLYMGLPPQLASRVLGMVTVGGGCEATRAAGMDTLLFPPSPPLMQGGKGALMGSVNPAPPPPLLLIRTEDMTREGPQ
jgi:hypothetical protein